MPIAAALTPSKYATTLLLMLALLSAQTGQAQTQASAPATVVTNAPASTAASAPASTTASTPASVAENKADELQSVEVKAIRDPAIMPYKVAYELMSKVRAASKDKVQILIRITSSKTHAPVPNLNIYLDGKNTHQQLEISATGFVNVPLDQAAYADGAEFVTNQKKGSMEVNILLLPKLPQDVFKYSDISESIEAAQLAIKELVPWYLRIFMPSVSGIGICYAGQNQTVLVKGSEEQQLPANSDATDPLKNKVHCARFAAKDAAKEKGNLIMPASGWQAIYM